MIVAQIEKRLEKLIEDLSKDDFIFDLLLAYNLPKASITRLRKGNLNLSKNKGEISWKKKLLFKEVEDQDPHVAISELQKQVTHDQRFLLVTDYDLLLAIDNKTKDSLDIELKDLPRYYDFFLPWAGMEKAQHANENPADVKAAERMAKLYDEIKKDNPDDSQEFIHNLNVFLSRLLFCFFAEDTNIFSDGQFTNGISSHTQANGSDLNTYLDVLFKVLNTPESKRENLPTYLGAFPYVNGGLFENEIKAPKFTRGSRQAIIAGGELDWKAINPDIFGSMFQAVIGTDQRGSLGQHYTSVPNIMKVIEPLFLNDLYEELEKSRGNTKKLNALLNRLKKIKIFDPACGSGNFLIIAYKELRRLEMEVFKESGEMPLSGIQLSQFFGIEIDDFAHEIAQLSLWLAEHQMNVEFFNEFGRTNPTLPLKQAGKIVHANACQIDWEQVCPKEEEDEIYILGNPPYQGFKKQDKQQKKDLARVFDFSKSYKSLDIISCWFFLASKYIDKRVKAAFVSTNSICQGVQVGTLWPEVLSRGVEIFFAYSSFKWNNSAKSNAGVTCVIVGLRERSNEPKYIYRNQILIEAKNINPYLINYDDIIVKKRRYSLSEFPRITDGSGALDGGHLILSDSEKAELEKEAPASKEYILPYLGSIEFIRGKKRWCLWIEDNNLKNALEIESIRTRIEKVLEFRKNAGSRAKTALGRPHKFAWINRPYKSQIIIPTVSSERRPYVPIGFLDNQTIVSNSASIVHDPEPYIFGLISSHIHMVWVKAVAGKLEERIRYTSAICYNTYPFPLISKRRKEEITQCVFRILEEREKHSDKTLAQLYDPDKMPKGLREAHRANNVVIEKCYRSRPFESDEERLEFLFKLYEKMIDEEKAGNTVYGGKK